MGGDSTSDAVTAPSIFHLFNLLKTSSPTAPVTMFDPLRQPLLDQVSNDIRGNTTINGTGQLNALFPIFNRFFVLEPSAPSLENLEEDINKKRRRMLRKIYLFLSLQMSLFAMIACLFVYM